MNFSARIKPVSYLKTHASEIVRTLGDHQEPLIITQNGEAKAILQDIDSFEEMQDTIALLRILALGSREIQAGQVQPAAEVIARLRERRARAVSGRDLGHSEAFHDDKSRVLRGYRPR